mmetsp:Transcript_1226/g.3430  ORF Transcript_1226/g.3430 Transcript_1226/m.3430 type:complete len:104 (+) Transcript_1226:232-543(+)
MYFFFIKIIIPRRANIFDHPMSLAYLAGQPTLTCSRGCFTFMRQLSRSKTYFETIKVFNLFEDEKRWRSKLIQIYMSIHRRWKFSRNAVARQSLITFNVEKET